jgi:hypothetical protein
MLENGALDRMQCLWFIPPGTQFEWVARHIDGLQDMQIGIKDQLTPNTISHPGGNILFLKELRTTGTPHYPMTFSCPSLVTLSRADIKELKVDNDDGPRQSAPWPKVAEEIKCPVCRKQAVPDGKTPLVLMTYAARMVSFKQNGIAGKMVWRYFCYDCFDTLGCNGLYEVDSGDAKEAYPTSAVPMLWQGVSAPFSTFKL